MAVLVRVDPAWAVQLGEMKPILSKSWSLPFLLQARKKEVRDQDLERVGVTSLVDVPSKRNMHQQHTHTHTPQRTRALQADVSPPMPGSCDRALCTDKQKEFGVFRRKQRMGAANVVAGFRRC